MICPRCKKENQNGSRFCEFCGTPFAGNPVPSNNPINQGMSMNGQHRSMPNQQRQINAQNPAMPNQQRQMNSQNPAMSNQQRQMNGQNPAMQNQQRPMNGQNNSMSNPGKMMMGQGNSMPNQGKFLTGQKLSSSAGKENSGLGMQPGRPKPPMDTKKRNILIGSISGAVVLLIIVIALVANHKTTIDLNEYITVEFSGYDSLGTASVTFDEIAFAADVKKKAKGLDSTDSVDSLSDIDLDTIMSGIKDVGSFYMIREGISWDLSQTEKLSNGDKVTLSFDFDNDSVSKYKIRFTGDEKEFSVSGLSSVNVIDPFKDITVEFNGISPDASAEVVNNSGDEILQSLNYYLSETDGIAKGDTITVTVDSDEEYLLEEYGSVLESTSKEFICEAVDEYAASLADIDEFTMNSMKNQTKDVISSYFASNNSELKKGKLTYEGCYFLTRKESDGWSDTNIIYVVYSTTVKSKTKSFRSHKVYMPVRYRNVIMYGDGTGYVALDSNSISGTTDLSYGWWSHVSGYTSENAMRNELVTSQKSEYNTESDGNLK